MGIRYQGPPGGKRGLPPSPSFCYQCWRLNTYGKQLGPTAVNTKVDSQKEIILLCIEQKIYFPQRKVNPALRLNQHKNNAAYLTVQGNTTDGTQGHAFTRVSYLWNETGTQKTFIINLIMVREQWKPGSIPISQETYLQQQTAVQRQGVTGSQQGHFGIAIRQNN